MSPYTSALPVPAQVSRILDKSAMTSPTFTCIDNSIISATRTEQTILDLLRRRAIQTPDKVCYIFLDDFGKEVRRLTYSQVDDEARRVAAIIQHQRKASFAPGDRVILCYPPGADFIIAFWGCLYAGAIACAVYPPHPLHLARDLPRFNRMVHETGATLVLTNREYRLQSVLGTLKTHLSLKSKARKGIDWPQGIKWLKTDVTPRKKPLFNPTFYLNVRPKDIAFFQYSSGATADPKPVMISHRNLFAQVKLFRFGTDESVMVGWLPPYHDNGLVGFNLAPMHCGSLSVQMSPLAFLKDPTLWMQMCSKYKATFTCAPNFAYLLAAKKTSCSVAASLDLSNLHDAASGAEPIRGDYLKQFAEKFDIAGFRPEQFNCAYGGAEYTLLTCAYLGKRTAPRSLLVDKFILETTGVVKLLPRNDPRRQTGQGTQLFIACGVPMGDYDLRIVNPDTKQQLPDMNVGEIWVHGDSIAEGYWQLPDLTRERLKATIYGDDQQKHFFRSGDLGFIHQGELFYYSRLQDIVEMDGRHICPQAIEDCVEKASEDIRPGCISVFAYTEPEEALVVIAELKSDIRHEADGQLRMQRICHDIMEKVAKDQQLECSKIVLIQPRTIPKTTSGKLQRNRARQMLDHHQLHTQYVYNHDASNLLSATGVFF